MDHRRFCDSRFRRRAWRPSASAQEVDCVLYVYRVATWRNCDNDPYASHCQFDNRLERLRDRDDDSDAAVGGGLFDLVFEASPEKGLDQLVTIGR